MENLHAVGRLGFVIGLLLVIATPCRAQEVEHAPGFDKDFFPILTWDLPQWSEAFFFRADGLPSLADCGFNTAAFVRPEHLPAVEKLKLRCIIAPKEFPIEWRKLSDHQIEKVVEKLIKDAGDSKAVAGVFLADEPGAPDFPALAKAVAAVKKLVPGKLAYINLFPDYATLGAPDISQLGTATYREYLEKYVATVHPQFISYDNYRIPYSMDQKDAGTAASYYNNLLEVRSVAMANHLPFWNIVASVQLLPNIPPPSVQSMMMETYTTLCAGGAGLTWYTYCNAGYLYGPIDKEGHRSATWAGVKMVNEQVKVLGPILRRVESTGVYFTEPMPAAGLAKLPAKRVLGVTSATALMIGEFAGAGGEYAMVVNLSLTETTKVTLKLQERRSAAVQVVSVVDGSLSPMAADHSYWLPAGQGVLLKLK